MKFRNACVLTGILLFSGAGGAKDLGHRLGVGYADPFGLTPALPGVALRYHPTADFGLQLVAGLNTPKDHAQFGLALKALRPVFREDNLNFFVAGLAGLLSDENGGRTHSGFLLTATVGVEFFFGGLDNLGFNVEAGVGVNSTSDQVRVRTVGDHPLRAGIFFYF